MKAQGLKAKTQSLQTRAEVRLVTAWACQNLRQNRGETFPYTFQLQCQPTRMARLVTQQESQKPFDASGIRKQVEQLNKLANHTATRYTVARVETFAPSTNPADADELVRCLDNVVKHTNDLLVQFAEAGNQKAVERLAARALGTAITLLKLTRSGLDLVKPVARQWGMWPVAYNPHRDSKKEMEAIIKKLEVGCDAPENVQGRWSNVSTAKQPHKKVLGIYTFRMMQNVLRPLHESPTMRNRLVAEVRKDISFLGNPPPLTNDEKAQLITQSWPSWIVDLVNLPRFSNASAEDWFEVGWAALKQAADGKVANIPELKPIGHSRAEHWRHNEFSKTIQESQREGLIHDRLRDAFLARFRVARKI